MRKKGALHIIEAIIAGFILLSTAIYLSKPHTSLYFSNFRKCLNKEGNIVIERYEIKGTGWINETLVNTKDSWFLYDNFTIKIYNSSTFTQSFSLQALNLTIYSKPNGFDLYYRCQSICVFFIEHYLIGEGDSGLNFLNHSFGVSSYEV